MESSAELKSAETGTVGAVLPKRIRADTTSVITESRGSTRIPTMEQSIRT